MPERDALIIDIVQCHGHFVRSPALRLAPVPGLAEDIAQLSNAIFSVTFCLRRCAPIGILKDTVSERNPLTDRIRDSNWIVSQSVVFQILLLAVCFESIAQGQEAEPSPASWLEARRKQQLESVKPFGAFHDFQFTDGLAGSEIRFLNRAVADANKHFKSVHYDHGTGMAVADVDGDGRLDIYFVSQLGGNQLWRNIGNGRFADTTSEAAISLANRVGVSAAFADIDNDGDPDLFVTTVRFGNVLFENLGKGRFRDISQEAGVGSTNHSSGAVFFDFDRDGWLDLFVSNVGRYTSEEKGEGGYFVGLSDAFKGHLHPDRAERNLLFKNLGGRKFKEVSSEMGLNGTSWTGDASFADLNQDGFPDLYVLNMQGDNHYYENQQGKRFVDKTEAVFPKTPWGAMGIKFFDFNQDGQVDLYITDMHSDMTDGQVRSTKTDFQSASEKRKSEAWCTTEWTDTTLQGASNNIFGNALFLNKGGGRFQEISDQAGAETLWPWGVSVADLNADGYEDVFITAGMGYNFRYCGNSLLMNESGTRFFDSEFVLGIEPRAYGRVQKSAFALDCSGRDKDHPLCQGMTGRLLFQETLSSRSSVIFDLDDDGDLDIVTNEMNDRPRVLVSNLSGRKQIHFLKIKLVGTVSNRDGLGAAVRVRAAGKTFTQWNDGKSGYLSQSSMPLYFGLGGADRIETVDITWPSGKHQTITTNVPINRTLVAREPL